MMCPLNLKETVMSLQVRRAHKNKRKYMLYLKVMRDKLNLYKSKVDAYPAC